MKLIRYFVNVFGVDGSGNSRCLFAAGEYHPPHADSPRHVLQAVAEEVDVTLAAEEADQLADKALAKAVRAVAAADEAEAMAKAATAGLAWLDFIAQTAPPAPPPAPAPVAVASATAIAAPAAPADLLS